MIGRVCTALKKLGDCYCYHFHKGIMNLRADGYTCAKCYRRHFINIVWGMRRTQI